MGRMTLKLKPLWSLLRPVRTPPVSHGDAELLKAAKLAVTWCRSARQLMSATTHLRPSSAPTMPAGETSQLPRSSFHCLAGLNQPIG